MVKYQNVRGICFSVKKGSGHVNHDLPVGINKAMSGLLACWTGNNGRPPKMKERTDMAPNKFLITVTPELLDKTTSFSPKCKGSGNDVVTTKGFQAKTPITLGSPVDKYKHVFDSTNQHTISKSDI